MSEYQYYEFQAIDRPLDEADQAALRKLSSRADITSRSFTNEYHWGDFRGKPRKLMERWFDLHLYVANWGTRTLMVRLPKGALDESQLDEFVSEVDEVEVFGSGENLIVAITFDSENSGYSYGYVDGDGWLDLLSPLRDDLLAGDLRLFYILWLTAVERNFLPDDRKEPLPGLGPLSAPHREFASFLGVDSDLVEAAAQSPAVFDSGQSSADASRKVIESIPDHEKSTLLLRLVDGDTHVAAELRRRIRSALDASRQRSRVKRRTVSEIREGRLAVRKARETEAARRKEEKRRREAEEAARAQRARLDSIKRRGARVWDEVETEIEHRNAGGYDRAAQLLVDLRALARETGTEIAFAKRVESIRDRHQRKPAFIRRLDGHRIGLG